MIYVFLPQTVEIHFQLIQVFKHSLASQFKNDHYKEAALCLEKYNMISYQISRMRKMIQTRK